MNYNQLIKKLDQKQLSPFYLLVGEESYLIQEALNRFISTVIHPEERSFNLEILDAEEAKAIHLKGAMGTLPFLGGMRLVIIKNIQNFKGNVDAIDFSRYLENPDPSIIIVITASTLEKKKKLKALLYKYGEVVELKKLRKNEISAWISKRVTALGKSIDNNAITYLIQCSGTNLGNLHNEIEKAFTYVGEEQRITLENIQNLVGDLQIDSVFALADAVGEKNIEEGLKVLKNITSHGSPPLAILGMLARQFRLIWQTKSLTEKKIPPPQIAKTIGVSPFFVSRFIQQSKKFSEKELRAGFEKMKSLDKRLKSSDTPPKILLEKLLFDFCIT